MHMRILAIIILLIVLAACSPDRAPSEKDTSQENSPQKEVELDSQEITDPATPQKVATTDEPIALPAPATGLAFWEHPSLPYEGLVIAATGEGVFAHTLEGLEPINQIQGINASGAQLVYITSSGESASPVGVFTTYDATNRAFRFFQIDNTSREFSENLLSIPHKEELNGWCLGASTQQNITELYLLVLTDTTLKKIKITSNAFRNELSVGEIDSRDLPTPMADCSFSTIMDTFFGLSKDGRVFSLFADGINQPLINSTLGRPDKLSINHYNAGEGVGEDEIRTKLFLLDSGSGFVQAYHAETGQLEGVLELTEFDEIKGVDNASAIAIGSGNYGGVYRFGVLALANSGKYSAVRLTPFLAAANALNIQVSGPFNIRNWFDQVDDAAGLELPELSIDLDNVER